MHFPGAGPCIQKTNVPSSACNRRRNLNENGPASRNRGRNRAVRARRAQGRLTRELRRPRRAQVAARARAQPLAARTATYATSVTRRVWLNGLRRLFDRRGLCSAKPSIDNKVSSCPQPPATPRRAPRPRSRPSPSSAASPARTTSLIDILYCGVCHSDLHTARGEWAGVHVPLRARPRDHRPCRPRRRSGHPLQGRRHRRRRLHGRQLPALRRLPRGAGAVLRERLHRHLQRPRTGGPAPTPTAAIPTRSRCDEEFVLRLPDGLDLAAAAPLLCAGITTYSPLRHWRRRSRPEGRRRGPGRPRPHGREARARDGRATWSCSPPRRTRSSDAKRLGADEVVISKDPEAMAATPEQLRLDPEHRGRAAQSRRLHSRC